MDKVAPDLMICYYRLSSEDGDVAHGNATESFSISAQRLCVRNFLASHPDLEGTVEEIVDDGYSGTNMNRPGMQRLLSLVKSGNVKAVIVRDLSRFSRNFLEGGHYLEFVFPAYGVRFISINDHFDSADYRFTGAIFSRPQHRAKNGTENADRKHTKPAATLSCLRLLRKPSGEGQSLQQELALRVGTLCTGKRLCRGLYLRRRLASHSDSCDQYAVPAAGCPS